MNNFNKVLFLGPHSDDEWGCSASLSKFVEEGVEVYCAVFSFCEESVPEGYDKDILKHEYNNSMSVLGVKSDNIFKFNFKVRYFKKYRQEILEEMVAINSKIKPDLVLLPSLYDIHQDHSVIAIEGVRAFKNCSIFGYEQPQNNFSFNNTGYIVVDDKHIDKKIESIKCYISQSHRNYVTDVFIRGLASMRGVQINEKFAEMFEVIRIKI